MVTKYNQHTDSEQGMVCEPAVEAMRSNTECVANSCDDTFGDEGEINELPSEILRMALECALDDVKHGRTIPHDKMMDIVETELGWK